MQRLEILVVCPELEVWPSNMCFCSVCACENATEPGNRPPGLRVKILESIDLQHLNYRLDDADCVYLYACESRVDITVIDATSPYYTRWV